MSLLSRYLLLSLLLWNWTLGYATTEETTKNKSACVVEEHYPLQIIGMDIRYQIKKQKELTKKPIELRFCLSNSQMLGNEQLAKLKEMAVYLAKTVEANPQSNTEVHATLQFLLAEHLEKMLQPITAVTTFSHAENRIAYQTTLPATDQTIPAGKKSPEMKIQWQTLTGKGSFARTPFWQKIAASENWQQLEKQQNKSILVDAYQDADFDMVLPEMLLKVVDKNQKTYTVNLKDLQLQGRYANALLIDQLEVNASRIKIANNSTLFQLADAELAVEAKDIAGLRLNQIALQVTNMTVSPGIWLKNLHLETGGEVTAEIFDYNITANIEQLKLPLGLHQEMLELSYHSDLVLQQLDVGAVRKLQEKIRALRRQQFVGGGLAGQMVGFAILGQIMQVLPQLIEKAPQVRLGQLTLETNAGKLQGQAQIGIDDSKPFSMQTAKSIVSSLKGWATFKADKSLLQKLLSAEKLAKMAETGFLVEKENLIAFKTQLKNGEWLVNGQKKTLPFFH